MNLTSLIDQLPDAENYDELLRQISERLYGGDGTSSDRDLLGAVVRAIRRLPASEQIDLVVLAAEFCDAGADGGASAYLCQAGEGILLRGDGLDDATVVRLLSAIAQFKGCGAAASIITELADDNAWCDCVRCYRSFDVSEELLLPSGAGAVSEAPQSDPVWTEQNAGFRLASLAQRAGKHELHQVLNTALQAVVECPHCRAEFPLYDAMLRSRGVMA